jgi:hypothetical protein
MSIHVFDHFINHFLLAFKKNVDVHSERRRRHRNVTTFSTAHNSHYFLAMVLTLFISIILALMMIVLFYSMEL